MAWETGHGWLISTQDVMVHTYLSYHSCQHLPRSGIYPGFCWKHLCFLVFFTFENSLLTFFLSFFILRSSQAYRKVARTVQRIQLHISPRFSKCKHIIYPQPKCQHQETSSNTKLPCNPVVVIVLSRGRGSSRAFQGARGSIST